MPPPSATVRFDPREHQPSSSRLETVARGFLILSGAMPGEERLPLKRDKTVVGREGTDIVIDESAMSRRHFEIEAWANGFLIRDLDSSNGTLVNGELVRIAHLKAGDKIQAGETTFTFSVLDVIPLDEPE